jgi:hypothetical protein
VIPIAEDSSYKIRFSRDNYEGVATLCTHPADECDRLEFYFESHYAIGTPLESNAWLFAIEGPEHLFVGKFSARVDFGRVVEKKKESYECDKISVVIYPDFESWKTIQWEVLYKPVSMFQKWCSWQREEMYRSEAKYWGRTVVCNECHTHDKERNMSVGFRGEPDEDVIYFCSPECWQDWWENFGFLWSEGTHKENFTHCATG